MRISNTGFLASKYHNNLNKYNSNQLHQLQIDTFCVSKVQKEPSFKGQSKNFDKINGSKTHEILKNGFGKFV